MIEHGPVIQVVLLLLRVGTLVATTPMFGGTWAPALVKIGLSLLLAITILPLVDVPEGAMAGGLVLVAVREFVIGFALGMSVRVIVAAAELGGYLIGFQLGFSYAGIVDPQSGVRNNVVAAIYGSLTLLVLLATNMHHAVLRVLVRSYELLPIGGGHGVQSSIAGTVASALGIVFYVGAQFAAPVVIAILVVEVLLGVIARAAPSLNLMVVGAPVRLLLGLMAMAGTIHVVPGMIAPLVQRSLELGMRLATGVR